jgi:hypothetical protein
MHVDRIALQAPLLGPRLVYSVIGLKKRKNSGNELERKPTSLPGYN